MNNQNNYSYAIAFGSNLGTRMDHINNSISHIESRLGTVEKKSSIFESAPIGAADQAFLNGALLLKSSISPDVLMSELLEIEKEGGRTREIKWGNRTIDLDIILVKNNNSNFVVDSEFLKVPHPEAQNRDFVMVPLAEICGDWLMPLTSMTVQEICIEKFSNTTMKKV